MNTIHQIAEEIIKLEDEDEKTGYSWSINGEEIANLGVKLAKLILKKEATSQ